MTDAIKSITALIVAVTGLLGTIASIWLALHANGKSNAVQSFLEADRGTNYVQSVMEGQAK